MSALLEVKSIVSGYGATQILHGVSFEIAAGEIVALLGSNGAGKSTTVNTLSAIVPLRSGSIVFDGMDFTQVSAASSPSQRVVDAGLIQVPEGRRIFPNLSVKENIELGAYRRARANAKRNFERVCSIFPRLRERLSQLAGTLSGGEQQMLAIGRALMAEPKLLMLDEPSLGLSPLLVEEMFALIGQVNSDGMAVLLVEQNVAQSLEIASRAYVMERGAVGFSGTPEQLLADPALKRAYLGL
jgi:branched-chain amino acid transport system ATP-binding protein